MELDIDVCVSTVRLASKLGPQASYWLRQTFKRNPNWGMPSSLMSAAARLAQCQAPNDEICAVVIAAVSEFKAIAKSNRQIKLENWPGFEN